MTFPVTIGEEKAAMTNLSPTPHRVLSQSDLRPSRPHGGHPKPSLRDAINAKCRECIYDPKSGLGTWREQVAACTSRTCPIYPARPLPRKGVSE